MGWRCVRGVSHSRHLIGQELGQRLNASQTIVFIPRFIHLYKELKPQITQMTPHYRPQNPIKHWDINIAKQTLEKDLVDPGFKHSHTNMLLDVCCK